MPNSAFIAALYKRSAFETLFAFGQLKNVDFFKTLADNFAGVSAVIT
jgi:hypothetical protein